MTKENDDGMMIDLPEDQLDLKLDDEGERKAAPEKSVKNSKAEDVAPVEKADDDAVAELRRQVERLTEERNQERLARDHAERKAYENAVDATTASSRAAQSEYDLVLNSISAAKSRANSLKGELKQAYELGEYEKIAELQMQAAQVATRLMQYEDAKSDLDARAERETARREAAPRMEAQRAPSDPFEARIQKMSPQSQAWLRQHRECVIDPLKNAEVMLAHRKAESRGIRPDTAEYFQFIDEQMGYAERPQGDDMEGDDAPPRRSATPAAPVSRESVNGSHVNGNRVKLTAAEVDMAKALGMEPAKYAANKMAMIKQGLWN